MKDKETSRAEVLMCGIGGMGVLVAGQLLAWAGLKRYRHISYVPSYEAARRGGLCEVTVILSDGDISSPILDQAQTVVVFDGAQLKAFEPRVRPGGLMLVESAGLVDKLERDDFRLLLVSGLEIAMGMGESLANNMILLGAYVALSDAISPQLIEEELVSRYGEKEALLKRNRDAFACGLELGRKLS
ncbi:2-oxoacid:acceptor oxidoreductase family protein [Chloroflexota bacterium]